MSYIYSRTESQGSPSELVDYTLAHFRGKFEGDDGLCFAAKDDERRDRIIDRLGLCYVEKKLSGEKTRSSLKLERYPDYTCAAFCGTVCDKEAKVVLTDPHKILTGLFFLEERYMNFGDKKECAYLRAKCLSYKYQYKDCPVVGPLVHNVLVRIHQIYPGLDVSHYLPQGEYSDFKCLQRAVSTKVWKSAPDVAMSSRLVVEDRFGISIEMQMRLERSFSDFWPMRVDLCDVFSDEDFAFGDEHLAVRVDDEIPQSTWPDLIDTIYHNGLGKKRQLPIDIEFYRAAGMVPDLH
jgi:hypothetical protein